VSLPPLGVIVALALAGMAGLVLLGSLITANLVLGVINRRLVMLQSELASICAATEPLGDRVAGITVNVRNLRVAAASFSDTVGERVRQRRDGALARNGVTP